MTMRRLFLLIAGFCVHAAAFADAPFPAPHSGATLAQIEQGVTAWIGKPVAFPGRVAALEEGYAGRPLLRILMAKPNPDQRHIWVSSQVPALAEGRQFTVGDIVIVYGRVDIAAEDDPVTTPHYDKIYHVLGECVVNATTKRVYAAPQSNERCQAWRAGQFPES